jgi:hypothetical protein
MQLSKLIQHQSVSADSPEGGVNDCKWSEWQSFAQWPELRRAPGVYEIRCPAGLLKVGIAGDLRRRMRAHARSRQSGLVSSHRAPWTEPSRVKSSRSILAKHLYFDSSVAPSRNLITEAGRAGYLLKECQYRFKLTPTREVARVLEIELERTGTYRYVGAVMKR